MAWLVRDGPGAPPSVLAAAELATDGRTRRRGLLGRDEFQGALVLEPCRQVHTIGMRFPLDVAFCDRTGRVLHVASLKPFRISRVVWRARFAVEAESGAFERWKLAPGDVLRVVLALDEFGEQSAGS